jgi:hypothetical protein
MKANLQTLLLATVMSVAVSVSAQPFLITELWKASPINPATSYANTNGFTQRSLSFNTETGRLLLASRAGGNKIFILDPETGLEIGQVAGAGMLTGGTFSMNMIGAADDGAIYAANLATPPSPLKVYRWESEFVDAPVLVYSGVPGDPPITGRVGDSMAVRGSGMNTEILLGTAGTNVVVLRPFDNVTNFMAIAITTDAPAAATQLSVAWGHSNTFWGKIQNQPLRQFSITAATTAVTLNSTTLPNSPSGIGFDPVNNLLAAVHYTLSPNTVVVYDAANPALLVALATNAFEITGRNVNTAAAFAPDKVFALNSANGLVASRVLNLADVPTPPLILEQPVGGIVLERGQWDLAVAASGSKPLDYQWYQDGAPVPDATNMILAIREAVTNQTGLYVAVVTNAYGAVTSNPAQFTVRAAVRSDALTPIWNIEAGMFDWMTTDNNQRGLAYNRVSGRVLIVSHTASNVIAVVDGATGNFLHFLNTPTNIVNGGYFALNMVGTGDEGAVYACNLKLNGTTADFRLYRWPNDEPGTDPVVAFSGDVGGGSDLRWGDCMDVRGTDIDTQILLGSRSHNLLAVLSAAASGNPNVFTSQVVAITNAPTGSFGLGIAWAEAETFWSKAPNAYLRKCSLDLTLNPGQTNTGTVLLTYTYDQFPSTIFPLGVDLENNYLAGISMESPHTVRLFDLTGVDAATPPAWIDTEYFSSSNPNVNGTGSVDFGSGLLYALDSNNGMVAYRVKRLIAQPTISAVRSGGALTITYTGVLQSRALVDQGTWTDVPGATSPHTVDAAAEATRFFRARQ